MLNDVFFSMVRRTPVLACLLLLACGDATSNGTTATTGAATSGSSSSTGTGGATTTVASTVVGTAGNTTITVGVGGSAGSGGSGGITTGGCSNIGGAGGSGGMEGDASASDATRSVADDAMAPPGSAGIVLRYSDLPPIGTGTSGTSGSTGNTATGGPPIDPNTQYIILGNAPLSCNDPYASGACGKWRVTLAVPPALFKPGVLQLGCGDVISAFSITGPDRGGGDCSGGGGSFNQGTLEIVSISSQAVVVRLAHTMVFEVNPNGLYEAARCP